MAVTETESTLTETRVRRIFHNCLLRDDETGGGGEKAFFAIVVMADDITFNVIFHPERIEEHREEIIAMLNELPGAFKTSSGWSLLNARNDKYGRRWTGIHQRIKQLFQLGIAIGRVRTTTPREMCPMPIGRTPYYAIVDDV